MYINNKYKAKNLYFLWVSIIHVKQNTENEKTFWRKTENFFYFFCKKKRKTRKNENTEILGGKRNFGRKFMISAKILK